MEYYTLLLHYVSNDRYTDTLRSNTPVSLPSGSTVSLSSYAVSINGYSYNHASYTKTYARTMPLDTITITGNVNVYMFYDRTNIYLASIDPTVHSLPYNSTIKLREGTFSISSFRGSVFSGAVSTDIQLSWNGNKLRTLYWFSTDTGWDEVNGVPTSYFFSADVKTDGTITYTGSPVISSGASNVYWLFIRAYYNTQRSTGTISISAPTGTNYWKYNTQTLDSFT